MAEKKMKICLLGASLFTGNMGVTALAHSLIKLVSQTIPNATIHLVVSNRFHDVREIDITGKKVKVETVNFRLSPRAKLQEHILWILFMALLFYIFPFKLLRRHIINSIYLLSIFKNADFIGDIRGGDSFSDIYGKLRFIIRSFPVIIAFLLKKEYVLLPQTYGPYKSKIGKVLAKFTLKKSSLVLSRDLDSIKLINDLLRKYKVKTAIKFCPDVAFVLDKKKPGKFSLVPELNNKIKTVTIGLNVSGLLYHGGYTRNNMFNLKLDYKKLIYMLIEALLNFNKTHIILVPHTVTSPGNIEDDGFACNEIWKNLTEEHQKRVHVLTGTYEPGEIKWIIGLCSFFIGSRMHSCIAALSQCIPTYGLAYSKKFIGVFKSLNMGDMVVDLRNTDLENTLCLISEYYKNSIKYDKSLEDRVNKAKDSILKIFKKLLIPSDNSA